LFLKIKRNDLVDQGQGQSREGGRQRLRGVAVAVILDDVVQRDAVANQEDLTIFVEAQELRQNHA